MIGVMVIAVGVGLIAIRSASEKEVPSLGRLYHKWASHGTLWEGYRYFYIRLNDRSYNLMVDVVRNDDPTIDRIYSENICTMFKYTLDRDQDGAKSFNAPRPKKEKFDSKDNKAVFNGAEVVGDRRGYKFSTYQNGKLKRIMWMDGETGFELKKLEFNEAGKPHYFELYDDVNINKPLVQTGNIKQRKEYILTRLSTIRPSFEDLLVNKKDAAQVVENLKKEMASGGK